MLTAGRINKSGYPEMTDKYIGVLVTSYFKKHNIFQQLLEKLSQPGKRYTKPHLSSMLNKLDPILTNAQESWLTSTRVANLPITAVIR